MQRPIVDRQLLLALLITLTVVVPRSWDIARQSSPSCDDQYHIKRGLWMLGSGSPATLNDPPLGEAIIALPLHLAGVREKPGDGNVLFNQLISTQTMLQLIGVWKAVLFVPLIGIVFAWCRRLYGLGSAWLATAMFLSEPTIAGHLPLAALDVLAMEAVIVAAYVLWRYVEQPTTLRLGCAAAAVAVVMLTKHNAIAMPVVAIVIVILAAHWHGQTVRLSLNRIFAGALLTAVFIWMLTGFDRCEPKNVGTAPGIQYREDTALASSMIDSALSMHWPAGCYLGSILEALSHVRSGQDAYLWGSHSRHGWWYYYLAVALYKVPVGIWLVIALGAVSLVWRPPARGELGLLVPIAALSGLLVAGGLNVGFRHALPAYGLILMLASRCVAAAPRVLNVLAWLGVTAGALHAASVHPYYVSYINAPWKQPWMAISDSNLDWCTSLPAVADWIDRNAAGRTVWLDSVDPADGRAFSMYLGDRVRPVPRGPGCCPRDGLLIVSPWWVVGLYESRDQYAHLRGREPDAIIAGSLLVFDLDRLSPPTTLPVDSAAP